MCTLINSHGNIVMQTHRVSPDWTGPVKTWVKCRSAGPMLPLSLWWWRLPLLCLIGHSSLAQLWPRSASMGTRARPWCHLCSHGFPTNRLNRRPRHDRTKQKREAKVSRQGKGNRRLWMPQTLRPVQACALTHLCQQQGAKWENYRLASRWRHNNAAVTGGAWTWLNTC